MARGLASPRLEEGLVVYGKYLMNPSIAKASYAHCRAKAVVDALQCGEDQGNGRRIEVPALVLHSEGAMVVGTISRGFGRNGLEVRGH